MDGTEARQRELVDRILDRLLAVSDLNLHGRERFFDRDKTIAVIKAVLWAHQVERGSHASAYAYQDILQALTFQTEPGSGEN